MLFSYYSFLRIVAVLADVYFRICFLFSSIIFLVQEVVLKDTPNEVKDPDGGCAC